MLQETRIAKCRECTRTKDPRSHLERSDFFRKAEIGRSAGEAMRVRVGRRGRLAQNNAATSSHRLLLCCFAAATSDLVVYAPPDASWAENMRSAFIWKIIYLDWENALSSFENFASHAIDATWRDKAWDRAGKKLRLVTRNRTILVAVLISPYFYQKWIDPGVRVSAGSTFYLTFSWLLAVVLECD
jgi:hypothetical protein